MRDVFYRICHFLLRLFFRVFFRLEIVNPGAVPEEGAVIIAANHVSYLDPPALGAALERRPTFMAMEELFRVPLIGAFARSFSFPVRRGRTRPSTIRETIRLLRKGELVVIFPEGGLNREGAKRGIATVARATGTPVIPALIEGTERALPAGARVLRPARIRVTFGLPILIKEGAAGRDTEQRIAGEIMEAIRALRRPARAGERPGPNKGSLRWRYSL